MNYEASITTPIKMKGVVPKQHSTGAAGYDLISSKDFSLLPGCTELIPTGTCIEMPITMEAQVRPRSSLSKRGILGHFGTIDSDYRGDIGVILTNTTQGIINFKKGERIAQLVFSAVRHVKFIEVEELSPTERGNGGFGSTGK